MLYARAMPPVWLLILLLLLGCSSSGTAEPRSWRMGFSAFPPRNDFNAAVQSLETWTKRADAAIFHISIPWAGLLAGKTPQQLLEADQMGIVNYYRQKQLPITVTLDLTDGLNRAQEAPQLIAARRSLSEPEIQTLYRRYAVAVAQMIRPVYMGLAAETNLIRIAASPQLYSAVVASASAAAQDVEKLGLGIKLYVSLQVETAWGRLQGTNVYVGAEQDFTDFSFVSAVGLSSYPYLGRFDTPEAIPIFFSTSGRAKSTSVGGGGGLAIGLRFWVHFFARSASPLLSPTGPTDQSS